MRTFTLIGSRDTSDEDNAKLEQVALELLQLGLRGRSGGAKLGPDNSFTNALRKHLELTDTTNDSEIYLPKYAAAGLVTGDLNGAVYNPLINRALALTAYNMCVLVHPVMRFIPQYMKLLHCRNVFQILGPDLESPSDFVITSARLDDKGEIEGGTATAAKIAKAFGVPIYNIRIPADVVKLEELLVRIRQDPLMFKARM